MTVTFYLCTRAAMAVVTLLSVDALAGTTLAGEATNLFAAFALIVILEILLEDPQR